MRLTRNSHVKNKLLLLLIELVTTIAIKNIIDAIQVPVIMSCKISKSNSNYKTTKNINQDSNEGNHPTHESSINQKFLMFTSRQHSNTWWYMPYKVIDRGPNKNAD